MTDQTTTGLALLARLMTALLAPLRPATAQALTDEQTARRADIAQFRAEFLARDRAYSAAARQLAEQGLAALEARAAATDPTRFGLAPDIAAPWSLHAYRRDLDPAMEAVAAALQRGV